MKFEFSMDVKGVPTARIDCKFECSPDELVTLISDPVYQGIGQKLINEVSFKPVSHEPAQQKTFKPQPKQAAIEELCNKVNSLLASLKKEREMNEKLRQTERAVCENFNRHMAKVAERTQKF